MKDSKFILVSTSEKWKAQDYGLQEQDMLCCGKQDIAKELRSRGGAHFVLGESSLSLSLSLFFTWDWLYLVRVIAVDQPRQGLEELLDGMRYRSQMIVLNPFRNEKVQLPLGNIIAKDLSIRAPCFADTKSIEKALELFDRNNIKVPTNRYKFEQDQINEAWKEVENRSKFDAPIILMHSVGI